MSWYSLKAFILYVVSLFLLSACLHSVPPTSSPSDNAFAVPADAVLRAGDNVRVTVFGDEALSGEYEIDGQGMISMPLIGDIDADSKTTAALRETLETRLSDGFIVDPKVSVEALSVRPFYILGEVNHPGRYPVTPELDAFKAIAIAGGLTPRAVNGQYMIYRGFGASRTTIEAGDDTPVLPGDSIRVKQRFF